MFNFFKKKDSLESSDSTSTSSLVLKISGMHCSSCSLSVDGELEDLTGVIKAETSYAKQESKVEFDASKVSEKEIKRTITDLGYGVN